MTDDEFYGVVGFIGLFAAVVALVKIFVYTSLPVINVVAIVGLYTGVLFGFLAVIGFILGWYEEDRY